MIRRHDSDSSSAPASPPSLSVSLSMSTHPLQAPSQVLLTTAPVSGAQEATAAAIPVDSAVLTNLFFSPATDTDLSVVPLHHTGDSAHSGSGDGNSVTASMQWPSSVDAALFGRLTPMEEFLFASQARRVKYIKIFSGLPMDTKWYRAEIQGRALAGVRVVRCCCFVSLVDSVSFFAFLSFICLFFLLLVNRQLL